MICYRDITFCVSPNCTCGRKLTPEIKEAAREWWKSKDNPTGEGAPIAVAYFCGEPPTSKSDMKRRNVMQGKDMGDG